MTFWFMQICIPFAIFTFCYLKIIRSLHTKINPLQRDTKVVQHIEDKFISFRDSNAYMKCRKNIAITLFYSTVMLIASWTGNQLQLLAYAYGYPLDMTSLLYQLLLLFVYLNGCVNPFIYITKYKRFRAVVAKQFFQQCFARRNLTTNIFC